MTAGIQKYRDELKGLAILWIVLFHSDIACGGALGAVAKCGYGGVDIFMLLSGFGLCRSLERSDDLRGYIKRRFTRLAPAYLPFCAVWLCVMLPYFKLPLTQSARVAVGSLTMTGFIAGAPHIPNWYVSLILVTVLLAPAAYAVAGHAKKPRLAMALMIALSALSSVAFWGSDLLMLFIRLPMFLIGMWLALPCEKRAGRWTVAAGAAAFIAGFAALWLGYSKFPAYLNDLGLYWYPFILITPPLCAAIVWLINKAKPIRKAFAPLRFLGAASFEIFLFNAWAEITMEPLGFYDTDAKKLFFSLISVALGCAYHLVVGAITKRAAASKNNARSSDISAQSGASE